MMPRRQRLLAQCNHKPPQAGQQNAAGIAEARRGVAAPLTDAELTFCEYVESIVRLIVERRPSYRLRSKTHDLA